METVEKNKYKKIGGGTLRIKGKIIKPNDVFEAYPYDIPKAFKDVVVLVSGTEPGPASSASPLKGKVATYEIKPRGASKTQYDVINTETGKAMNTKPLGKAKAEELKSDLEK